MSIRADNSKWYWCFFFPEDYRPWWVLLGCIAHSQSNVRWFYGWVRAPNWCDTDPEERQKKFKPHNTTSANIFWFKLLFTRQKCTTDTDQLSIDIPNIKFDWLTHYVSTTWLLLHTLLTIQPFFNLVYLCFWTHVW